MKEGQEWFHQPMLKRQPLPPLPHKPHLHLKKSNHLPNLHPPKPINVQYLVPSGMNFPPTLGQAVAGGFKLTLNGKDFLVGPPKQAPLAASIVRAYFTPPTNHLVNRKIFCFLLRLSFFAPSPLGKVAFRSFLHQDLALPQGRIPILDRLRLWCDSWHMYTIVAKATPSQLALYLKLRISHFYVFVKQSVRSFQLQRACDCLNRLVYAQPTFRPCLDTDFSQSDRWMGQQREKEKGKGNVKTLKKQKSKEYSFRNEDVEDFFTSFLYQSKG